MSSTPGPEPRPPTDAPPGGAGPARPDLVAAVEAGLHALTDLDHPHRDITCGDLESTLRALAARHQPSPGRPGAGADPLARAATAARTTCAHLNAGDLVDAYLALRTAHDALPHRYRDEGATPQALAVAEAEQRTLADRRVVDRAVGVLAQQGGTSSDEAVALLRGHAQRHGFVLTELASDVVARRVGPAAILDPAATPTSGQADRARADQIRSGPHPSASARTRRRSP